MVKPPVDPPSGDSKKSRTELVRHLSFLSLCLLLWAAGFLALSDKAVVPAKRSCGELQQVVKRLSQSEASTALPAVVRFHGCRSVHSGDYSRYQHSEYAAVATLTDGRTILVHLFYGQDDQGERVYALERYDSEGRKLATQSVPRVIEHKHQPPTVMEHAFLSLGVMLMVVFYVAKRWRESHG